MNNATRPALRTADNTAWSACALVGCLLLVGCLDADAMIEARQDIAIQARMEEVDLGEFRISLPQPSQTTEAAEVYFHAFGQVVNRDVKKVRKTLESSGPELRHRLLLATRQLTVQDLEDPPLTALRSQIAEVINETLPDEPLQSVGFYRFVFSNL